MNNASAFVKQFKPINFDSSFAKYFENVPIKLASLMLDQIYFDYWVLGNSKSNILQKLSNNKYGWTFYETPVIVSTFDNIPGMYVCNKCQSSDISTKTVQVRRADEGATTFAFCKTCYNKWVLNG